jgi:hypothetical protein
MQDVKSCLQHKKISKCIFVLLVPFSNAQEISQGYRNEYLVMLFATVFTVRTIYIAAKNPPEVIGCEKNHPLPVIHKIRQNTLCVSLFSSVQQK